MAPQPQSQDKKKFLILQGTQLFIMIILYYIHEMSKKKEILWGFFKTSPKYAQMVFLPLSFGKVANHSILK